MYHAHFGLERGLFGDGIAADAAVFRTARHDRLIAHFKLALGSPSAAVALRGPAGVGKTTLTSAALRMTSTRLALAWLSGAATNPAELLELILVELGVNTVRTTRIERVQLWRQFQAEMRATESRLFLVVERTEDLSADVLHALDQLTAPDAAGNPGANLVLLGNEGLDAHLAAPVLDSLRQRIRLRGVLEPFTEAELQDYLRHQTACAGGSYDRIFAPGAAASLYRYSRGVARLANNLCESALDVAAVQRHKQVTSELVARTAVTLLGLQEPMPLARAASNAVAEPPKAPERSAVPRSAPVWSTPTPASASAAAASSSEPRTTPAAPPPPSETNDSLPPRAEPVAVALSAEPPALIRSVDSAPLMPAAPMAPFSPSTMPPPSLPPLAAAPTPALSSPPPVLPPSVSPSSVSPSPISPPSASPPAVSPSSVSSAFWSPPAAPPPVNSFAPAPTAPAKQEVEFDGGATDVADVALADFPVLTDAVEPHPAPVTPLTPVAPKPAPSPTPPPTSSRPTTPAMSTPPPASTRHTTPPTPAPPAAASKPAFARTSRIETAYTATRPPSPALAAAAPAPRPPAASGASPPVAPPSPDIPAKPAAAIAPANPDDDDELRQTQTMRAISAAKSIDDISSSMAETLFSDAELDLVTAALAAEWADDEDEAAAAPAPAPEKPAQTAQALSADDPFDLFGLGDDAPLELIDDSAEPPKSASR